MTPTEFSSTTLAWFFAIAAIIQAPVSLFLWGKAKALYLELKGEHAVNAQQIADNTARLDRQGETQRALFLASAPANTQAPAPPPVQDTPTIAPQSPASGLPTSMGDLDRNEILAGIEALKAKVSATPDPAEPMPDDIPRMAGEEATAAPSAGSQE